MILQVARFISTISFAVSAQAPLCPDLFGNLRPRISFIQVASFESYFDRLSPKERQKFLSALKKQYKSRKQLEQVFATEKDLSKLPAIEVTKFRDAIGEILTIYGFKVEIDTQYPGRLKILDLPKDHPLREVFNRSKTTSTEAKYFFDVLEFIDGTTAGSQFDDQIYLRSFFDGRFNLGTALHEIGHRHEQLAAKTDHLNLYNIRTEVHDAQKAEEIFKLSPDIYRLEMNEDELVQHEKAMRRLYTKEPLRLTAGSPRDLTSERIGLKQMTRQIADAVLSRATYAELWVRDNLKPGYPVLLSKELPQFVIHIRSPGGASIADLSYNLQAVVRNRPARRSFEPILPLHEEIPGQWRELMPDGTLSKQVFDEEHIIEILENQDKLIREDSIFYREKLLEMIANQKARALKTLKYLSTLP